MEKFNYFKMAERSSGTIILKEFKEIIDEFDDVENARVYFYEWMYYKEDLVEGII